MAPKHLEKGNSLCLLPDDVSLVILSFLEVSDWSNMRLAQKSWSIFELTQHNLLWAPVFQSIVDRPLFETIKSSVLSRVQSVDNYRDKVLTLKQVVSEIVDIRKADIPTVPPILNRSYHKYLGFAGLDKFSAKKIQATNYHLNTIKVSVVGDQLVGKTSMIIRTVQNCFQHIYHSSMLDNFCVDTAWGRWKRTITFWDIPGSDVYDHLRPLAYPSTDLFLVCFSVVNPSSFQNVARKWLVEIMHHWPDAIVMLVGTKIDLRDNLTPLISNNLTITPEEGEHMAKHHNCILYVETSALTGQNLRLEFHSTLARCSLIGHYLRRKGSSDKCILC